jgi:hypothetical protein
MTTDDCDCSAADETFDNCPMGGDHNCVRSSINSGIPATCSKCTATC